MGAAIQAELAQHAAHLVEVTPEFHHHGRFGVAQALFQLVFRQYAGEHAQALVAVHQRGAEHRGAAEHGAHAGHHFHLIAVGQTVVQVHVGAVEERVALADHRHVLAGVQQPGDLLGAGVVEVGDHILVGERRGELLGGHRVDQRQTLLAGVQMGLDDAEGIAAVAGVVLGLRHEVGHHRRRLEQTQGLEGKQLGVAGADAEAEQTTGHHSTSEARALTAATAMALPPRRPRTIT